MTIISNRTQHLQIKPSQCLRCGMNKSYHAVIQNGKKLYPCLRKQPYKLRDGVDVKLGMQIWEVRLYEPQHTIITGQVGAIFKGGGLYVLKYPEEVIYRTFVLPNGEGIEVAHEFSYEWRFDSKMCYSSLKNAQAAIDKELKLRAWREAKYGKI